MHPRRQPSETAFSGAFQKLPIGSLTHRAHASDSDRITQILRRGRVHRLEDFASLLAPQATEHLERMAQHSQKITQQHFGKTIRLFAPIYLSNECVNICEYCGFSKNNTIPRITIPVEQAVRESRKLSEQGFRSLLIVAGEHPKYVNNGYVSEVIRNVFDFMPHIGIELGPMETKDYLGIVDAGCEGLIAYQETYHQPTYEALHKAGPKQFYHWRLDTVERGYAAGFRRLGIGALFGLYDWRYEAISVAAHALYLLKHCWKAQLTISLPRMRPAAGGFQPHPEFAMSDRELVQTICAFRLLLPTVGIVLSTRETPQLRNGLMPLGITTMSAGACTEPGGYSHFDESQWQPTQEQHGEQFHIADERSPSAVAQTIRDHGYEPIWKDFDQSLLQPTSNPILA